MKDVELLRRRLREIDKISNKQWMERLNDRKRKELQFHDKDRDRLEIESLDKDAYEKVYGNRKYYQGTSLSRRYVKNWIQKNAGNGIFLDYACGNGENAIQAAKNDAMLAIGIDVSQISISNAKREAKESGVGRNTCFVQADAENTLLPDSCIDAIVCSGVLHHLDLSYAFPELHRLLRPGGKILALEALGYNPAIRLYRCLTPQMRTEWEKDHILSLSDIRVAQRYFRLGEIRYWHILSILAPYMKGLLPLLNKVDSLLTRVPLVRFMAWIFTFELIKPVDES